MEFIIALVYETVIEGTIEGWTNFMKKRNANYDSSNIKQLFTIMIGGFLIIIMSVLILGLLFLIEWKFPNLLDVVRFDLISLVPVT